MPKAKTRRSVAKRFKVTGSGRIRREQAGAKHLKVGKTSRRLRRLKGDEDVSRGDRTRVARMLGR